MLLVQKWPFFQLFLLGNIGQENHFYDILKRKNAFLGYKNKKFKKFKILPKKKKLEKWPFLDQKPWVNPFGKMSIF